MQDNNRPNKALTATEFKVENAEALERLDRFLSRRLEGCFSREKIKKSILNGFVLINNIACTSPKRAVLAGEVICLLSPEEAAGHKAPQPEAGELDIIYQDEHLAVINKEHGISVHPSPAETEGTLLNRLLAHFPSLAHMQGERPGIVHRLDKDTTGLLLVALDEETGEQLMQAFAMREVDKEYLALVYGVPQPKSGRIDAAIGRDQRNKTRMAAYDNRQISAESGIRDALSNYRTLYADPEGRFSLLAVNIHSGRTHQIRVHLTHIGHPVIGDAIYFDEAAVKKALSPRGLSAELKNFLSALTSHQLLHAWQLHFKHPAQTEENPLSFCAEAPAEFTLVAQALSKRLLRVVLTGNPACGKSSVLKILQGKKIPVWSADTAVAEQYQAGADGWELIRAQYGASFMHSGVNGEPGDIDKHALFKLLYNNDIMRRSIEDIIHPIVFNQMLMFWNNLDALPLQASLAVAEVPLYLESPQNNLLNSSSQSPSTAFAAASPLANAPAPLMPGFAPARPLVLGVHCPFEMRAARMREKRQWSDSMIEKMESWQLNEKDKMAACDFVIDNSGSPEALLSEVERTLSKLKLLEEKHLQNIADCLDELTSCIK